MLIPRKQPRVVRRDNFSLHGHKHPVLRLEKTPRPACAMATTTSGNLPHREGYRKREAKLPNNQKMLNPKPSILTKLLLHPSAHRAFRIRSESPD